MASSKSGCHRLPQMPLMEMEREGQPMKYNMFEIEVATNEFGVLVIQPGPLMDPDNVVVLHPSQVEILCGWLKEAAKDWNRQYGEEKAG